MEIQHTRRYWQRSAGGRDWWRRLPTMQWPTLAWSMRAAPPAPEMEGNGFSELNRQTTHGGCHKKSASELRAAKLPARHRFPIYAYPNAPREFIEGEMQAHGFMQGIALFQQYWLPVFDHAQGQQWLRPLSLLGVDETEHHPIGEPVQQIDTTAKERHMSGSASLALAVRARNGKR
ncbi:hypothetical protein [Paraburkholderia strydomiana]|uniref:Uncharacterized protein n=1 Tax=Paraburkholderia strydomiana TaxID=1245417 RepID=A0ABW9CCF1_9BURK